MLRSSIKSDIKMLIYVKLYSFVQFLKFIKKQRDWVWLSLITSIFMEIMKYVLIKESLRDTGLHWEWVNMKGKNTIICIIFLIKYIIKFQLFINHFEFIRLIDEMKKVK